MAPSAGAARRSITMIAEQRLEAEHRPVAQPPHPAAQTSIIDGEQRSIAAGAGVGPADLDVARRRSAHQVARRDQQRQRATAIRERPRAARPGPAASSVARTAALRSSERLRSRRAGAVGSGRAAGAAGAGGRCRGLRGGCAAAGWRRRRPRLRLRCANRSPPVGSAGAARRPRAPDRPRLGQRPHHGDPRAPRRARTASTLRREMPPMAKNGTRGVAGGVARPARGPRPAAPAWSGVACTGPTPM